MRNTTTFCCLIAALMLAGCQGAKSEAGSTDPHGPYSPEDAKAAAQSHFQNRPAPRSPGQNSKQGQ